MRRSAFSGAAGAPAGPPSFSVNPADYRLMEEVGYGAHAVVYRAIFLPTKGVVAVKCLDLDQLNNNIVSSRDALLPHVIRWVFFGALPAGAVCCLI